MSLLGNRSRRRRSRAVGVLVTAGVALAGVSAPATASGGQAEAGTTARVTNGDFLIRLDDDLYLLGPNGRNLRRLTRIGDDEIEGRFSPDGSKIVFSSSGGLYLMNSDGTRLRSLAQPKPAHYPSFSRDGSKVGFRYYYSSQDSGIAFMDARPGAPVTTAIQDGSTDYCEEGPVWPDGQYHEAAWSPVADQFAVLQDCFADPMSDHLVRIIGPLGKRIAAFGRRSYKYRLDFSPDGRRIVYTTEDRDGNRALEVIDRRTNTVTVLTDEYTSPSWAAWSPDGARIAATEYDGIYTMRASDGGDWRLVKAYPDGMPEVLDWRAAR